MAHTDHNMEKQIMFNRNPLVTMAVCVAMLVGMGLGYWAGASSCDRRAAQSTATMTQVLPPPPPPPPPQIATYVDGKFNLGNLAQCIQHAPAEWLPVLPKTEAEARDKTDVVFTINGDEVTANFRHLHMGDIEYPYMGKTVVDKCPNGCWDITSEYVVKSDGTFVRYRALDGHMFQYKSADDFVKAANRALQMSSCRR